MPLSGERKAIRFSSIASMMDAIWADQPYQHRHLVLGYLQDIDEPTTRKDVCDHQDIPINAISKVTANLLKEGVIVETGSMICPSTGRNSRGIQLNKQYKGLY